MKNIILLIIFIFSISGQSFGQWKNTYGPVTGEITGFVEHQGNIFAAANGGTVFMNPKNKGNYWKQCYSGMLSPLVQGIISAYDKVFVVSDKVYYFDYSDSSWRVSALCNGRGFSCISADSFVMIAGTQNDGVYVSFDSGTTWHNRSSGLPEFESEYDWIYGVHACNNMLFAGTDIRIAVSHDSGAGWTVSRIPSNIYQIYDIVNLGSRIFLAGKNSSLWYSDDSCKTWERADSVYGGVLDLLIHDGDIYASCGNKIYYSTDTGETWKYDTFSKPNRFKSIWINNDIMYGGTYEGFIWTKNLTSSINQKETYFEIRTFPNPVSDELKIQNPHFSNSSIEGAIYDILGHELKKFNIIGIETTLNISEFAPGIYFVKVKTGDKQIVKKILKE